MTSDSEEDVLNDDVESGPDGWDADPLWHITDIKSHSPNHSWWFGDERTGNYSSSGHGTQSVKQRSAGDVNPMAAGARVYGVLTSAPISLLEYDRQARVGFWYWREVEEYDKGGYDKTIVQVKFGGSWCTVWALDSKTPSEKTWKEVRLLVDIPAGATQMQVRFIFDSVDGLNNAYAGWFVDDISVGPLEGGTVVVVPSLTDGTVGEQYGPVQLTAYGGVGPYVWSWTGGIPGLLLDQRAGTITGIPTTSDDYVVTISATDSSGSTGTATCTIHINEEGSSCTLLTEVFADPAEWSMTSLWHIASAIDCLPYASLMGNFAYFANSSGCSYKTGTAVSGELHSPAVNVPADVSNIVIEFDQYRHVEQHLDAYDKTHLDIRFNNSTWETLWYRDASDMSPEGSHVQVTKLVPAGANQIWIRFRFDSVDEFYNDYPGWAIDNVQILNAACVGSAPPPPPSSLSSALSTPAGRGQICISNWPNPVTDVHTTTFTVRGENVEAMKIQIFSLSGELMYEQQVAGNQLEWHTDNNCGEYLANGVYQYRALVKVGDQWVTTDIHSVVIVR